MKRKNDNIHYKKIQIIKQIKKENSGQHILNQNINIQPKNENEKPNKIFINQKINILNNNIKINDKNKCNKDQYEENNHFNLDDINNQLDEILENIELDGIDEINKKIKYLGEDKKMLNTITYEDNKNMLYKKLDNKNKKKYERNKIYMNTEGIDNYHRHYHNDNKNISNNRYLFTSVNNNTYRHWKDENNCINDEEDEDDNYFNKTNISLFYKYNNFNNYNKSNNYFE